MHPRCLSKEESSREPRLVTPTPESHEKGLCLGSVLLWGNCWRYVSWKLWSPRFADTPWDTCPEKEGDWKGRVNLNLYGKGSTGFHTDSSGKDALFQFLGAGEDW